MRLSPSSNPHSSVFTSMYSSGTDSKNNSVANPAPNRPSSMPAVVRKREEVKFPVLRIKGCSEISRNSSGVKVVFRPVSVPKAEIRFVTTKNSFRKRRSFPVKKGCRSYHNCILSNTISIPVRLARKKPANCVPRS